MINIDVSKLTPMMQQYMKIKNENKDCIVFYRLGDFYEMFFDDAITASRELELALTGRDCGLEQRAPMCGVPHHVSDIYLNRLVNKGYKVALVDQIEDPKQAKGIVKRGITRIFSPGTLIDLDGNNTDNNFLLSIYKSNNSFGISYIDVTTGELNTTEIEDSINFERELLDFIVKVNPREIICNKNILFNTFDNFVKMRNIFFSKIDISNIEIANALQNIKDLTNNVKIQDIKNKYLAVLSTSYLLDYIYLFREEKLSHITSIKFIQHNKFMKLDASTRENLELHRNLFDGSKKFTLLSILDKAKTPMGSRKINSWIEFPLVDKKSIEYRLNIVEYFVKNSLYMNNLISFLSKIYDLERILGKIAYSRVNARDLLVLKNSLEYIPNIKKELLNCQNENITELAKNIDELEDIYNLIENSILEDSPIQITEGNLIKNGFSNELDRLKDSSSKGKIDLVNYENKLKEDTGIKNLRISYNKNTGYYIELTKSNIGLAPSYFIRRQTLKNAERYITEELNMISDMILGGQTETVELEYKIFNEIKSKIADNSLRIKNTADIIANVDALLSFAFVAKQNDYSMPVLNESGIIEIIDGRHPVIENTIGKNLFISNNTSIGRNKKVIQIITGPNMAGKSTYMRQVALIIIMTQIGSFVPARACDISISDALFSRIGASDNLAKGDSTFMVEMKEMSNIITNATKNSFVILDEVGRGTSTNDGYSIAKAIVEYMSKHIKCKTLFATHYHELTSLESSLSNLENLKVDISEEGGNLIFLRKIMKGKADRSYGIEVAKLSGLPDEIILRASYILSNIDEIDKPKPKKNTQKTIFNLDQELFIREVSNLNVDEMTPREGLNKLYYLNQKAGDLLND